MNAHTQIPVRQPDPFAEWERQDAELPRRAAERPAKLAAMAAECDRAWEAAAPAREREAVRKQAIADAEIAALSRQFLRMWRDA